VAGGLAAAAIANCFFFVDETEYAYITRFGRPIQLHIEAGWAWKWPFESVRRFDRRLQMLNPAGREMLTQARGRADSRGNTAAPPAATASVGAAGSDTGLEIGQNLNIEWYVTWRLPGPEFAATAVSAPKTDRPTDNPRVRTELERAVLRFLQAVGTTTAAEARLEDRVWSALRDEVGHMSLNQFVSLNASDIQLAALSQRLAEATRATSYQQFGLEVVDVRIKRFNHPASVKPDIYETIRKERQAVADRTRVEGKSRATVIRGEADRQKADLLSRAYREAAEIRGRGEAEAMRIANEAHSKDPDFFAFLSRLETYRKILNEKTTVVLSANSPLMKLLTEGVGANGGPLVAPAPGKPSGARGSPAAREGGP
jgi:membrane protease subunit HflC